MGRLWLLCLNFRADMRSVREVLYKQRSLSEAQAPLPRFLVPLHYSEDKFHPCLICEGSFRQVRWYLVQHYIEKHKQALG